MNKKLLAGTIIVVIVVAGALWFAFSGHASTNDNMSNMSGMDMSNMGMPIDAMSTKDALNLSSSGKCLANDAAIKTQVEKLDGLAEDSGKWSSEIYDVPAGTNVQVNVATYSDSDMVTGSLIYPEQYGSYNYMLMKSGGSWQFTQFTRCN